MKTSELTGALLDYWVGRANNINTAHLRIVTHDNGKSVCHWRTRDGITRRWKPSIDWTQAGQIIERDRIELVNNYSEYGTDWLGWAAYCVGTSLDDDPEGTGPTPLIAAMRAYVAAKFGPEVPDVEDTQ